MLRRLALALLLVAVLFGLARVFEDRRMVALRVYGLVAGPEELLEPMEEAEQTKWFDDYFTVEWIDDRTVAIGEPRFPQFNFNYLLLGRERALLFDSGPGVRDIRPVVDSLTKLPVTVLPSHLHYDHVGSVGSFERVALLDLPALRERSVDGVFTPTAAEHLGFAAGHPIPELRVTDWLAPGSSIDLGGRELRVIHAPGHTPESVALHDPVRRQLFTGDYITQGALYAFVPGSSLRDYLATAEALAAAVHPEAELFTAHRTSPFGAPILAQRDVVALRGTLEAIRDGTADGAGLWPRRFRINRRIELWTDFEWTERWK